MTKSKPVESFVSLSPVPQSLFAAGFLSDKGSQLKLSELQNNSTVTFTNYVELKQWSSISAVHQQSDKEELGEVEDCGADSKSHIFFMF